MVPKHARSSEDVDDCICVTDLEGGEICTNTTLSEFQKWLILVFLSGIITRVSLAGLHERIVLLC